MNRPAAAIHAHALRLLAARDHSRRELAHKLHAKFADTAEVEAIIALLESDHSLDDNRYADHYCRRRAEQGYGPQRIRAELRERGIAASAIDLALGALVVDWRQHANQLRQKRFGGLWPQDLHERARQLRFLQYRGFEVSDRDICLAQEQVDDEK
jgi:regulatory protein